MVWLGALDSERITENERDCYLQLPLKSQTTNPIVDMLFVSAVSSWLIRRQNVVSDRCERHLPRSDVARSGRGLIKGFCFSKSRWGLGNM